jgi:hypothetical protein
MERAQLNSPLLRSLWAKLCGPCRHTPLEQLEYAWESYKKQNQEQVRLALGKKSESGVFAQSPVHWLKMIARNAQLSPESLILDIGTGNGLCAHALHLITSKPVHSVELDETRHALACDFKCFFETQVGKKYPDVLLKKDDVLKIPLQNYDLLYFFATLPAGNEALCEKILEKCAKELKIGARVFISNFRIQEETRGRICTSEARRKRVQELGFASCSLGASWKHDCDGQFYPVLIADKT